jgi:hypothetical protein
VYVVDVVAHNGALGCKQRHRQADINPLRSPPPDRARLAISMKLETAAFGYLRERWY